jgi:hypothetical protein
MIKPVVSLVLAQVGSTPWLEGAIFVLLTGAVLFAICRSSGRN